MGNPTLAPMMRRRSVSPITILRRLSNVSLSSEDSIESESAECGEILA